MGVEPKIGVLYPKMDGENNGKPSKWMIWGYPYLWQHPYQSDAMVINPMVELDQDAIWLVDLDENSTKKNRPGPLSTLRKTNIAPQKWW